MEVNQQLGLFLLFLRLFNLFNFSVQLDNLVPLSFALGLRIVLFLTLFLFLKQILHLSLHLLTFHSFTLGLFKGHNETSSTAFLPLPFLLGSGQSSLFEKLPFPFILCLLLRAFSAVFPSAYAASPAPSPATAVYVQAPLSSFARPSLLFPALSAVSPLRERVPGPTPRLASAEAP